MTTTPQTFRKKPVEIEAIQWTGDNDTEVMAFVPIITFLDGERALEINTLEGRMRAEAGDWIIREPFPTDDRRFYPCKPDIFEATYDAV